MPPPPYPPSLNPLLGHKTASGPRARYSWGMGWMGVGWGGRSNFIYFCFHSNFWTCVVNSGSVVFCKDRRTMCCCLLPTVHLLVYVLCSKTSTLLIMPVSTSHSAYLPPPPASLPVSSKHKRKSCTQYWWTSQMKTTKRGELALRK